MRIQPGRLRLQRFGAATARADASAFELVFKPEQGSGVEADGPSVQVASVSVTGTTPERVRRLRIRDAHEVVFDIADVLDARRNVLSAGVLVESMALMGGLSGLAVDLRHMDLRPQSLHVDICVEPADAAALETLQVSAALC